MGDRHALWGATLTLIAASALAAGSLLWLVEAALAHRAELCRQRHEM